MRMRSSLGIMLLFAFLPLSRCLADVESGFSVTPFYSAVTVNAKEQEKAIMVAFTNRSDVAASFRLSAADFGQLDESGGISFFNLPTDYTQKYGLASWIQLDRDVLSLNPGETQSVEVTVVNRETLSTGGHYGAVIARMEEAVSTQGTGPIVALNPSFSSLIFLKKEGGEKDGLVLDGYEIRKRGSGEVESIKARFQNTGNTHVIPRGIVRFLDPLGRVISRGVINRESAFAMPETFRSFAISMEEYEDAFLPGNYTVAIKYRYEGQDDFAYRQSSVFYFPKKAIMLLSALGVLLLGSGWAAVLLRRKRKRNRGQVAKGGEQEMVAVRQETRDRRRV